MTLSPLEAEIADVLHRHVYPDAKINAASEQPPDFILAQFLLSCLDAWNVAVRRRDQWLGRRESPITTRIEETR